MSIATEQRSGTPQTRSSFVDLTTLMRIKSLAIRARVVMEGFYRGIHRSPFHGFSVEFSEYREYSPGDDPRYLDWKLYARTDRYYIKRFEDETNLRCTLVVDSSRSMGYGSRSYTKIDYARTAAATLASFLIDQRDAAGLLTFDDKVIDVLPARYRPGQLRRLLALLERTPEGRATDLQAPLEQIAATVQKRGLVVLLSDFLIDPESLKSRLGLLKARGHDVIAWRILDPAEVDFPFDTPAWFQDLESGRELYVDPTTAKASYQRNFQEHANAIEQACVDLGIDYRSITIDESLELILFELIQARLRRLRQPSSRAGSSARGGQS